MAAPTQGPRLTEPPKVVPVLAAVLVSCAVLGEVKVIFLKARLCAGGVLYWGNLERRMGPVFTRIRMPKRLGPHNTILTEISSKRVPKCTFSRAYVC